MNFNQLVKKQTTMRILWLAVINIAIMLTLLIVSGGALAGFLPFILAYAIISPFCYLLFSKFFIKRAYAIKIVAENDEYYDWYVDMVYTIAERAGLTEMPEVGIYEADDINAFATGRSRNASLIACSTALLDQMSIEAIEGVIAHEVAHIVNGDMVTSTLLQATMNMIIFFFVLPITAFKWFALFFADRYVVFFVTIIAIAEFIIAKFLFFLASLITNTFSRHREFKADHLAAQLTHPTNMIQALHEISGYAYLEPKHKKYATLQFNGSYAIHDIFSTHPNTARRITQLQTNFNNMA